MFTTMHEIVAKLMSDERLADALADLAILRDETASVESQYTALQGNHDAAMEQMKAEVAAMQQQMEAMTSEQVAKEQAMQTKVDEMTSAHVAKEQAMQAGIEGATQAYKKAVLAANPEIPAEMMNELDSADSVEAIDAALGKAKSLVEKIKANLGVPGGAPTRNRIDLASMSSFEKIRHAISQ
ncbi:MAG: hypothetical protein HYX94_10060 [Chloroflexi bacterium]|nr:hypothetical protein [Chloroflexota bacterium]